MALDGLSLLTKGQLPRQETAEKYKVRTDSDLCYKSAANPPTLTGKKSRKIGNANSGSVKTKQLYAAEES